MAGSEGLEWARGTRAGAPEAAMSPSEFEGFVNYLVALCGVVALLAVWRLRKRGPGGLFLVAAAVSFGVFLLLLAHHAGYGALYFAGLVVAFCLAADFAVRKKPEGP